MNGHRVKTIALLIPLSLAVGLPLALAQPENFATSLHATREGKSFWYSAANGGFEALTGIPIEQVGCKECHGPTNANGDPYPSPFPGASCNDCHSCADWSVQQTQCLGCHGRQATESGPLGLPDVHREAGMVCWDCHGSSDLHGDGNQYESMLEPGAIDAACENCHGPGGMPLPTDHATYDPHNGALHCAACHTESVISCYNCHFESQVDAHVKRAKQPLSGFVMLVNREKDGKVYPASFQSVTYDGKAFVAFGPYAAHSITAEGRSCPECHNINDSNEAITQYNATGLMRFTQWDDQAKTLSWLKGIVPIPEDYQTRLKMDFITYDGDPADPPGPSTNWSSIGKDTWDAHQMFFASPLTRSQMDALGFVQTEPSWHVRLPLVGGEFNVAFEEFAGILIVTTTLPDGRKSPGLGMQINNTIYWMDVSGSIFFGNINESAGTMQGIVFGGLGSGTIWFAELQ